MAADLDGGGARNGFVLAMAVEQRGTIGGEGTDGTGCQANEERRENGQQSGPVGDAGVEAEGF